MRKVKLERCLLAMALIMLATWACIPSLGATDTPLPPTEVPSISPTEPAAPTEPLPPTAVLPAPTPTVVHVMHPDEPGTVDSYITDPTTKALASQKTATGDQFNIDIYERPYTSEVMDYLAHLDIVYAELSVESTWAYVTIFLEGEPPADSHAAYSIELDTDLDQHGDWLITAFVPPSDMWTTDGVRIFHDDDEDVGGDIPLVSEAPVAGRTGYETIVFEEGFGPDPDAAWVRRDPEEPDRVQLAFKISMVKEPATGFFWAVFAEEGGNLPAWYDFNDHFTKEQAGSPFAGNLDWPIKLLAAVDSTCRYAYGFEPAEGITSVCGTDTDCVPRPGFWNCYLVGRRMICSCEPTCNIAAAACARCMYMDCP
jgi:hypothetical protein